ncbi:MAG: DNA repair protein RecO [Chloroflexota bacterium]
MRNLRLYRTEAVILKRADFGETDRLITVYTPQLGKLRLLAKGIRRPTSKMAGHLELFTQSQLLIAKGRNLDLVTQCETINSFLALREELLRTTYAHYVAELVERLTPEHLENYPLYSLLLATLGRVATDRQPEMALRFYEMQMLEHLGYRPQLLRCLHCDKELEPVVNYFTPAAGGAVCPACGEADPSARPLSVNALKVLRLLQSGNYTAASRLRLDDELRRELEGHMRHALQHLLERDVKSLTFLNRLRMESGSL